ncbi:DUF3105 domain-containing protein [Streptosporangium sp. 'caverna']|uniref:DUF3105 domain-containing protein n=2 Tax=Streptosporangium subroseum TaxID=106412 RepID=A0A239A5G5_9ACTN|nr:DUF3105 domain-containing protein [Streptosporangium sp. 'caverna']AWS41848.1 DUF3105 domain-containing protein [Streptosporangium sp. 'caverna']SNR90810.1 Protein of unknown function [Streptosporangium subroseum]
MTKEKAQSRRDHLVRMRAEQKRKERRTAFLMWGAGGAVILVLVGFVAFYLVKERATTSLDAVTSAKYPGSLHVQTKVKYKENPPVGGEHNPAWQNCGIYDQPLNNENAVHSMEHGAVWITYQPDLPKAQVDKLKELASKDYMLLSPYPGLPAKVVASSWNKQLKLDSAEDPRLPKFISTYKNNSAETPELGAACDGGVSTVAADAPIPETTPTAAPSSTAGTDAPVTSAPSSSPTG